MLMGVSNAHLIDILTYWMPYPHHDLQSDNQMLIALLPLLDGILLQIFRRDVQLLLCIFSLSEKFARKKFRKIGQTAVSLDSKLRSSNFDNTMGDSDRAFKFRSIARLSVSASIRLLNKPGTTYFSHLVLAGLLVLHSAAILRHAPFVWR